MEGPVPAAWDALMASPSSQRRGSLPYSAPMLKAGSNHHQKLQNNGFSFKLWKWTVNLRLPSASQLDHDGGSRRCPPSKAGGPQATGRNFGSPLMRDTSWEFFEFTAKTSRQMEAGFLKGIRGKAKSAADLHYKPIKDNDDDYDGDVDSDDDEAGSASEASDLHVYAEIRDSIETPSGLRGPSSSTGSLLRNREDSVCLEPFPTILHVTKIKVPPLPPKHPFRGLEAPPTLLPPYPSCQAKVCNSSPNKYLTKYEMH